MDLRQIEYFVRVAELGSFTRAALALRVAQPALSRQVRQLEVEYRQPLLLRNGRGVTPTAAGRLLLEQGRGILHQVERLRQELGSRREPRVGKVALGLPPSLSRPLAVPLAREFAAEMPQAALAITEGLSAAMQEALVAGRLDLALLFEAAPRPEIDLKLLGEQPLWLIERRGRGPATGRAIGWTELAALPLVIPTRPNAIRMRVEAALAQAGLRPTVALEIDAVAALLELVLDGRGAAVLTREAIAVLADSDRLRLRPIGEPPLHCRLSLATSARRPMTPMLAAATGLIERTMRRQLALKPLPR